MITTRDQCVAAGVAGFLIHAFLFSRGEWHLHVTKVLGFHVIAYAGLILLEASYQRTSWLAAFTFSSLLFGIYTFCLLASISIYRIFFHRLRSFPGPVLASVTKFWHVAHCLDSKSHLLLEKLHQEYGDFVRTGPNELTIFTPDVLSTVNEGNNNTFIRSAFFDTTQPYPGLAGERDKSIHDHRRRVWNHAFTTKALRNYEAQVKIYAEQLEHLIAQSEGQPLVANKYFQWFSFDVMGQVAFSKDFNMMRGAQWHSAIKVLRDGLKMLGPLTPVPWLMCLGSDIPIGGARDFKNMVSHYLIDWSKRNGSLEKDRTMLYGDSLVLVNAGSDTVALTLIYIFYRLARHPEQLHKLQKELDDYKPFADFTAMQHAQHLNGIINETMRLHPASLTGNLRVTPPGGAEISGRWVPGDVVICTPRYTIGKLESCFDRAHEFIPERWYSKPEMVKNKNAFAPFSLGYTNCIGKTLAMQELRCVTALLASKYDVSFPPGEDGRSVEEDTLDEFIASPGDLKVVFRAREKR